MMDPEQDVPSSIYAVVDVRTDGRKRVLAEYVLLHEARAHALALRLAGAAAEVEVNPPSGSTEAD